MRSIIITVEIADPDFSNMIAEFERLRLPRTSDLTSNTVCNLMMTKLADFHSNARWPNQIMRVHKYKANLPALHPDNTNRPW